MSSPVKNTIRKAFEVYINDKTYDVWNIEDKEHPGQSETPNTWWLYYSDRLPGDVAPPIDSDNWEPYHKWTKRLAWDIRIKDRNTTKYKWNEWRFSNHTTVEMWCNGKHIYSFMTGDTNFAFAKAQTLMVLLFEHPFNFLDQDKMIGRKIQYYGLPALVGASHRPGEISIIPDYSVMKKAKWWKEYRCRQDQGDKEFEEITMENVAEYMDDDKINHGDVLCDGKINWFRN